MSSVHDQIGPYILMQKLGKGAFGEVWLVENRTAIASTQVALKLPLREQIDLEAIKQEALLWAKASGHPNILPIIEANIYNGQIVIVSEYAAGGSLESFLEKYKGKAPSLESSVEITLGILAGLEHLHKQHIIHRDLKPANILLQGETPRLADFGLSRVLKVTTHSSSIEGTPTYMAPETFDGKRSEQTDIWAVGVMFYQMMAGRCPFFGIDMIELVGAILTREPIPLPNSIPTSLQRIVKKSLAKAPDERYRSAKEMRDALKQAILSTQRYDKSMVEEEKQVKEKEEETEEMTESNPGWPASLWKSCWNEKKKYVDFTYSGWFKLPQEKQVLYSKKYQEWYATYIAKQSIEKDFPLGNTILKMVLIPPGRFLMGSPDFSVDEKQHAVLVSQAFWCGKYAVTQSQWQSVMEGNPSSFKGEKKPLEQVSWTQSEAFSEKSGTKLLTEAQWEYACRAGTTGSTHCKGGLGKYAWYGENSENETHDVGEKEGNGWGIHDMYGNVWEWCRDWYGEYLTGELTDPTGRSSGSNRVIRGGSWGDDASECRSALRGKFDPGSSFNFLGLRLCMSYP